MQICILPCPVAAVLLVLNRRGDHGPLTRVQVSSAQVRGDDQRERIVAAELSIRRLDCSRDARLVAVPTVENRALVHDDRLPEAALGNVVGEGHKLYGGEQREDVGEGVEFHRITQRSSVRLVMSMSRQTALTPMYLSSLNGAIAGRPAQARCQLVIALRFHLRSRPKRSGSGNFGSCLGDCIFVRSPLASSCLSRT